MVLPDVSTADVRAAIARLDREGLPAGRGSTKFCLDVGGRHYPPKYVVALAARRALGRELRPDEFSGGAQTNELLERLGFAVMPCNCGGTRESRTIEAPASRRPPENPRVAESSSDRATTIVRIVSKGRTPQDARAQERMLLDAFGSRWPTGLRAKFVLTPGGFVHGTWPSSWKGRAGWDSRVADIEPLFVEAERQLARVVTERVYRTALGKADVLTIGIDLGDDDDDVDERAELVAVIDIAKRAIVRWTGKSYPTPGKEEHRLVHVIDLNSHLLEIAGERVFVLGCHDLNMFNPRGHANQDPNGARRARCDEMKRKVARFKPTVVLQHPHSTDTPNIWRMPWLSLARDVPSARAWASGIAFYNNQGGVRAKLDKVLDLTRSSPAAVRDLVVDARSYG
jgi:hypothetical protein